MVKYFLIIFGEMQIGEEVFAMDIIQLASPARENCICRDLQSCFSLKFSCGPSHPTVSYLGGYLTYLDDCIIYGVKERKERLIPKIVA